MQTVYRFKLCPNQSQRAMILRWRTMLRSFYNFCLRDRIDSYAQTKLQGQYCDLASLGVATPLTCSVNRSADIGYPWKSNELSKRRNPKGEFKPKRSPYEMQSSNISYLRETRPWYQEISYDVLQQSLRNGQKAKSQLNKAISDASWYALRVKTNHQASKLGNQVITVNPRGSSQTCYECGYVSPKNRDKEKFVGECCGYYEDADIQAAQVLQQRTIEAFFNSETSQKSAKKSKSKSSKKSAKKLSEKSSNKLERPSF